MELTGESPKNLSSLLFSHYCLSLHLPQTTGTNKGSGTIQLVAAGHHSDKLVNFRGLNIQDEDFEMVVHCGNYGKTRTSSRGGNRCIT